MTTDPFDQARDHVYSVAPAEFADERSRLVKLLRSEGHPTVAADVQKLRRPSIAAWSVDQAARDDPRRVQQLFGAGEALGQAHEEATSGRAGTAVRDATRRRRALVEELTERALRFAASLSPNPDTHRDAIEATWEAASLDPDVQPLVAAGWLAKELPRPTGFELGASQPATATRERAPSSSRKEVPRDELALRRARAAVDEARRALQAADDALAHAESESTTAHDDADAAAQRVDDLEAALVAARAEAREAARAAKAAEQAATKARAARSRAAKQVERSERAQADREQ
jgi:hypothetical protein